MELTEQEQKLLHRINDASKWDNLWWELSYIVPSVVLLLIGTINGSKRTSILGLMLFIVFHSRMLIHQVQSLPVLKGLCEKMVRHLGGGENIT